jgi:serralysin
VPIGAVQTASGYDVAFKDASSGLYTVWTTDANGNYLGNAMLPSSGNSYALESLETIFNQDLNGDGVIGLYASTRNGLQISQPLSGQSGAVTIEANAVLEIGGVDSATVTFAASTGLLKIDQPSTFTARIYGFTGDGTLAGSDQIDLSGVNFSTVHDSYANGVLTVTDGTHSAELNFNGSYALASFKLTNDGSGGTIVYDPPLPDPSPDTGGTLVSTDANNDAFVFHPNLGQSFGGQRHGVVESSRDHADLVLATLTTMHEAHDLAFPSQIMHDPNVFHEGAAVQAPHHSHFLI